MPVLQEMTRRALDLWDRVRRYYFKGVLVHRARRAQAEHRRDRRLLKHARSAGARGGRARHNQNALAAYTVVFSTTERRPAGLAGS